MGLNLARDMNITLLSRAKSKHFLIYNGVEQVEFDAKPNRKPTSPLPAVEHARS